MWGMDIKIGFIESGREIAISSNQEEAQVTAQVQEALASSDGILQLVDDKDNKYFIRHSAIAYVSVGSASTRHVGFASN